MKASLGRVAWRTLDFLFGAGRWLLVALVVLFLLLALWQNFRHPGGHPCPESNIACQ